MDKKYLSIKEVAEILGVSTLTLRNWDKADKLKAFRHPINNYRVYLSYEIQKVVDKIESGEHPIKHKREIKDIIPRPPISYKLKVIHM